MSDVLDFGLSPLKKEGELIVFDDKSTTEADPDRLPTRWIEMCYDPNECTSHIENVEQTIIGLIDSKRISGEFSEDDVYLLVKSIANKLVED